MKPVKCPNNHYYDAERFSECPHCKKNIPIPSSEEDSSQEPRVEHRGKPSPSERSEQRKSLLFSRKDKKHTMSERRSPSEPREPVDDSDDYVELPPSEGRFQQREETISLFETQPIHLPPDLDETPPADEDQYEDIYSSSDRVHEEDARQRGVDEEPKQKVSPKAETETHRVASSLQRAISATGATAVSSDAKTVGLFSVDSGVEPVVGWLVCVKGQYMGEPFALKSGRNNIGRSLSMDVPLAKEASVSRDRHAVITFEPKKQTFIIQAGESNGLTYLNGELVVTYNTLKNYDTIQLGQAEFKFMAFCGNEFSWEDYIGK